MQIFIFEKIGIAFISHNKESANEFAKDGEVIKLTEDDWSNVVSYQLSNEEEERMFYFRNMSSY